MVILLSFLSSTEQQQNNVIIVAALAQVLTSFSYSKQFLKSAETTASGEDSQRGLTLALWSCYGPGAEKHGNSSFLGTLSLQ